MKLNEILEFAEKHKQNQLNPTLAKNPVDEGSAFVQYPSRQNTQYAIPTPIKHVPDDNKNYSQLLDPPKFNANSNNNFNLVSKQPQAAGRVRYNINSLQPQRNNEDYPMERQPFQQPNNLYGVFQSEEVAEQYDPTFYGNE